MCRVHAARSSDNTISECCGKIIREILPPQQRRLAGGDSNWQ